jgi:hypothetical protein
LWDDECDVVVRSLGSRLHSQNVMSCTPSKPLYERPHRSNWLQKLPEVPAEARDVLEELFVKAGSVS